MFAHRWLDLVRPGVAEQRPPGAVPAGLAGMEQHADAGRRLDAVQRAADDARHGAHIRRAAGACWPRRLRSSWRRPGIGVIVDGLYDRLERDRELGRHFRSRRPGERERLKQFFKTIFGGEVTGIRDVGVQRHHLHRLITAGESARWLSHLGAAMQAAGVGQSAQAAVMDLLQGPAARLVNDGAPKDVLN